jgi:hypothetical protein
MPVWTPINCSASDTYEQEAGRGFVMGFLDWVFKQRYDTEKQLLQALAIHTEAWHNELSEPLKRTFDIKIE